MFTIDDQRARAINTSFQIPAKPKILQDLQEEQAQPEPDSKIIADIISRDVALSANVLKAINSPVFGLNRTVSDIKQSVVLLGVENVNNLVTFFVLRQNTSGKACIPLESFWDTALEIATLTGVLLEHLNLKHYCPLEDVYAAGLFRDCGIPIMASKYTDYKDILSLANAHPEKIITQIEEGKYGTNHAVIGYFVVKSWNLPNHLCELILQHHEPDFLQSSAVTDLQKDMYAVLKVSSNVLSRFRSFKDDVEWLLVKDKVLDYLAIQPSEYVEIEEDIKVVLANRQ